MGEVRQRLGVARRYYCVKLWYMTSDRNASRCVGFRRSNLTAVSREIGVWRVVVYYAWTLPIDATELPNMKANRRCEHFV